MQHAEIKDSVICLFLTQRIPGIPCISGIYLRVSCWVPLTPVSPNTWRSFFQLISIHLENDDNSDDNKQ